MRLRWCALLAALVLALAPCAGAAPLPRHFCAVLDQSQVVPPTGDPTHAMAQFHVTYLAGTPPLATDLDFHVQVTDGTNLTQAHLHCAPAGANGPVVAFLGGRHDGGVNVEHGNWLHAALDDSSVSSTGTGITAPVTCNAPGSPQVATVDDLVQQIVAGNIYVCLHDRAFPAGAIRGQLSANCGGR